MSFHQHQFASAGNADDQVPLPRLSHKRLMAIVNGRASLSMLRDWHGLSAAGLPAADSMAARRALFAGPYAPGARRGRAAVGSFCPPLAGRAAPWPTWRAG